MKGPHERLKYDLRRVWECPACGHCERTSGETTTMLCGCQRNVAAQARRFMRLRDDGVRRVHPPGESSPVPAAVPSADLSVLTADAPAPAADAVTTPADSAGAAATAPDPPPDGST